MSVQHMSAWGTYFFVIAIMLWGDVADGRNSGPVSQAIAEHGGSLELTLSLGTLDVAADEVLLQLTLVNTGEHSVTVPHIQQEAIEPSSEWGHYGIIIHDQDWRLWGRWRYGERIIRFTKDAFIQLDPRESVTVPLNIAQAQWLRFNPDDHDIPSSVLSKTTGEYAVSVFLEISGDMIPNELKAEAWTGRVESNTLAFVLQRPGEPVPRQLRFPTASEDGVICQCRADCDQTLADNACLQLPLDARSQIATAIHPRWQQALELARKEAQEKIGGAPKPQPCFCMNPQGEKWVDY